MRERQARTFTGQPLEAISVRRMSAVSLAQREVAPVRGARGGVVATTACRRNASSIGRSQARSCAALADAALAGYGDMSERQGVRYDAALRAATLQAAVGGRYRPDSTGSSAPDIEP